VIGRQRGGVIDILRVIQAIHDCAVNPHQWWTTLAAIVALTQSRAAVLSLHGAGIFHCGHEPEYLRLCDEHFRKMNALAFSDESPHRKEVLPNDWDRSNELNRAV